MMSRSLCHEFEGLLSPPEVFEEVEDPLHGHPSLHQLEPDHDEELWDVWPSITGSALEAETPLAIFVSKSFPDTAV